MANTDTGHRAERAAAGYLEMRGFEILELNWRRPRCEIDIVARRKRTMYFIEVKYRKNDAQGSGLEYVTDSKLRRMQRGAYMWVEENEYNGPYQLGAVEVGGTDFIVEHFIDNVL